MKRSESTETRLGGTEGSGFASADQGLGLGGTEGSGFASADQGLGPGDAQDPAAAARPGRLDLVPRAVWRLRQPAVHGRHRRRGAPVGPAHGRTGEFLGPLATQCLLRAALCASNMCHGQRTGEPVLPLRGFVEAGHHLLVDVSLLSLEPRPASSSVRKAMWFRLLTVTCRIRAGVRADMHPSMICCVKVSGALQHRQANAAIVAASAAGAHRSYPEVNWLIGCRCTQYRSRGRARTATSACSKASKHLAPWTAALAPSAGQLSTDELFLLFQPCLMLNVVPW